ncbi:MAG TPA: type VI secretion system tube protein Hcp [Acetobacteraceae bacterium]|jgi:type VI secretion system secreted protein Hcp
MPIYMKYAALKGDVTAEGHKDWIELNSFQWGVGRGISSPTGASNDRESSAPSVSEITVTKAQDVSTIDVLNEAYVGEGKDVTIDFCKTDKGKLEVYLSYILTSTMISGYSISAGGDRPSESLSLNFTKVECKMNQMDETNAGATSSGVTYDIGKAKIA